MFTHLPKLLFAIYSTAVNSRQYSRRWTGPALLPKYLPKDGYATLIVGFVRLNGNRFVLPYSAAYKKHHKPVTITIPPVLADKTMKEIRIIPKADARQLCRGRETTRSVTTWGKQRNRWSPTASGTRSEP